MQSENHKTLERPANFKDDRLDIVLLHCLLTTEAFHVDELVQTADEGCIETALSLSVLHNDVELIKYLRKVGASPDIMIGPVSSMFNKPSMLASDRPCPEFQTMILQYCQPPARVPVQVEEDDIWRLENDLPDQADFLQLIQSKNIVQFFDKGIEYDRARIARDPNNIKTWTRLHRAYVYATLNQRRPNGPLPEEFQQIALFLDYKGDISVNSWLIDEVVDRKTALFEAISSKNFLYVEWLLKVQKADPNQVSYTDGVFWHEADRQSNPIEQTLRGFLVWDEEESEMVGRMMDLILDHGCTKENQTIAFLRILRDDIALQMVCVEVLHFMRMTERLLDRTPDILTEDVRRAFNHGLPLIIRVCESKWFDERLESPTVAHTFENVIARVFPFLRRMTPSERFSIRPETSRCLTINRSYRTLACLLCFYDGDLGSVGLYHNIIRTNLPFINPIYCEVHQATGFPQGDVIENNRKRVHALMIIMVRSLPVATAVKDFLLDFVRILIDDQTPQLPAKIYSLQNRCISVMRQTMKAGSVKEEHVKSVLPPTLFNDIFMSGVECSLLASIEPTSL
ncbi:hypothetical protein RvY_06757 [Ramazzottius varieornatus]|uniref:SOCS box domain-containing protein n=1 Tax=Ramazzottius varieornatus TaxID=947166 RepID=A0A1D1UZP5_RAMVA|nr:hypothetical protein RvY_06757 [Ramazzottius varieornatus]